MLPLFTSAPDSFDSGILLGPSGMGQIAPDPGPGGAFNPHNPTAILFPYHEKLGPSNTRNYLNVLAQLGVVVFMFVVGLEVRESSYYRNAPDSSPRAPHLLLSSSSRPPTTNPDDATTS